MWWKKKPEPENLKEWLEIATKNIVLLEAEAIAREIKSHYQDELEFQISYGKTELEATKIALAELGNAHRENRQFVKLHVCTSELNFYTTTRKDSSIALGIALVAAVAIVIFDAKLIRYFPPMISVRLFSNFLESYFLERGQLFKAVKASQRANLILYPIICLLLSSALWQDLEDWQFQLVLVFICLGIYGFFSEVIKSNEQIWKFKHYFQKYPHESYNTKLR